MVQCCRCNGSGLCKNCSCVKTGKACIDCLPIKKQHCSNSCRQQSVTSPPQPSFPTVHSQLNSQHGDVFPQPSSRPSSQSLGQPGASSTSTLDGLRRDLSNSGPLLMSTKSNKLPDYQPVCKSSFVWGNIDSASLLIHWILLTKKQFIGRVIFSKFHKAMLGSPSLRNSPVYFMHSPPVLPWNQLPSR